MSRKDHLEVPQTPPSLCLDIIQRLQNGDYNFRLTPEQLAESDPLGAALQNLAGALESRRRERQKLEAITTRINAGLLLDEVLDNIYQDFRELIPYERIGLALIEDNGQMVRSYWAKSELPGLGLQGGFSAPLAGSSLETIIQTGQPRILNDLEAYLTHKPQSHSTRLIVEEGFRASLTCPLVVNDTPVGFIFFSSVRPNAYANVHIEIFQRIAEQLSIIVEKGRLASELAAQKQAVEQQNDELRRLNDLKNTFLGIASHDLRNPVGYIETCISIMADPSYEFTLDDYKNSFRDILKQTNHILTMLDDLLDVTRIEAGKLDLKLELLDLIDFLAETVARHDRMARTKGSRVTLESLPALQVTADPMRLRQVMDNLISNAVKYSPPGSQVRVGVLYKDGVTKVYVQDEGPGIKEADRTRLFQDFARLSARPTGGEKSTGLGLAITRRVVEAHGGQIGVDSDGEKGASFWFTLVNDP